MLPHDRPKISEKVEVSHRMSIITQDKEKVKRDALPVWREKKLRNERVAKKLYAIGLKERSNRMKMCGTLLDMKICPDCGASFVRSANLCRDRLCPTCEWRLSLQRYAEMCNCIGYIADTAPAFDAKFLTLTIRNCAPGELRDTIRKMSAAWHRMMMRKTIKKQVIGWARSLEITYNTKTGTFHPHFHIIMLHEVGGDEGEQRAMWNKAWTDSLGVDYAVITDFRTIKSDEGAGTNVDNEALQKAILETYKYSVKSDEIEDMPLPVFRTFVAAISGIRFCAFGGVIKAARAVLDCKEELDSAPEDIKECRECGSKDLQEAVARWSFTEHQYNTMLWNLKAQGFPQRQQ